MTQFIKWRSQLRVTNQFTKRVQKSGARMSCNRGNKTHMKQLFVHRTKSCPPPYLTDVMNTRIELTEMPMIYYFSDFFLFMFVPGFLTTFPFFVNSRKFTPVVDISVYLLIWWRSDSES